MFLTDSELLELLERKEPPVVGLDPREGDSRYDASAPVQPCSIDLSIGNIYSPGAQSGKLGSKGMPLEGLNLNPGTTAVVETLERFQLPSNVGAIGFPPNSVSAKGILMTNPGHVDPGYDRKMTFTVINMSEEPYTLLRGNKIVTLLFFKLNPAPERDLAARDRHGDDGIANQLAVLSPDFLGINKRVQRAAADEEQKTRRHALIAPIVIGIIAALAAIGSSSLVFRNEINDLRAQVNSANDVQALERRIRVLEQSGVGAGRADNGRTPDQE